MYFGDPKSKDNKNRRYDPRQDIRESAGKKHQLSSEEELFRDFSKKPTKVGGGKPTFVSV